MLYLMPTPCLHWKFFVESQVIHGCVKSLTGSDQVGHGRVESVVVLIVIAFLVVMCLIFNLLLYTTEYILLIMHAMKCSLHKPFV